LILGLDISTSCTGWSLLTPDGTLASQGYIRLAPLKSVFRKAERVRESILKEVDIDSVKEIYIEQNLQSFRSGFSSAQTLSTLARFNGIVSYLSSQIFNSLPLYINVNSARKSLQIKINKKSNLNTKEQVFQYVRSDLKENFVWPEKILKRGPNKGLVKFDESCYDMSDAYVICKAGFILNGQQNV